MLKGGLSLFPNQTGKDLHAIFLPQCKQYFKQTNQVNFTHDLPSRLFRQLARDLKAVSTPFLGAVQPSAEFDPVLMADAVKSLW